MGNKLHVFTGRLVSAYIDRQLCEMSRLEALEGHTEPTPQRWAKLSSDAQTLPPVGIPSPPCVNCQHEQARLGRDAMSCRVRDRNGTILKFFFFGLFLFCFSVLRLTPGSQMMLNDKWDPTTRHARMDPHCQSTNSRKHKLVIPPGTVGW